MRAGKPSLRVCRKFLSRHLWLLRGWPVKVLKMLGGDEAATQAIDEFRSDAQRFDHLAARRQACDPVRAIYERSPFHLVATQQVRQALELSGWRSTPALTSFLESLFRCCNRKLLRTASTPAGG